MSLARGWNLDQWASSGPTARDHAGDQMHGRISNGRGDGDELLTTTEVARRFHVSPKTVRRWALAGKVKALMTPGGQRRFSANEINALLRSAEEPDGAAGAASSRARIGIAVAAGRLATGEQLPLTLLRPSARGARRVSREGGRTPSCRDAGPVRPTPRPAPPRCAARGHRRHWVRAHGAVPRIRPRPRP